MTRMLFLRANATAFAAGATAAAAAGNIPIIPCCKSSVRSAVVFGSSFMFFRPGLGDDGGRMHRVIAKPFGTHFNLAGRSAGRHPSEPTDSKRPTVCKEFPRQVQGN